MDSANLQANIDSANLESSSAPRRKSVRTAVVIVHGMGEQLPLDTLNRFVKTALPKVEGQRRYYSRPERVTDSYEARRHLATRQPPTGLPITYGQTEFFEYHWSYLMTGNKLGDLRPTMTRLLLRSPATVPYGLKKVWWLVWLLILVLLAGLIAIIASGVVIEEFTTAGVLAALLGEGILVTVLVRALNSGGNVVTKSFVDVVRYLDRSPRSYEVRRSIRKGMVDLLQAIHDKGRYSRIVIVAHSLGAYIAYDAIGYLWPQMCKLHCGPLRDGPAKPLVGLAELEAAARAVAKHPAAGLTRGQQAELAEFRVMQFDLWRGCRIQGNPWLITDFISVGTPMYFADLLYTKNRADFDQLVTSAELPQCPPRAGSQLVEGPARPPGHYGFNNQGRTVLTHGAPLAVVRWTNLFFPAERSWFGDWFGGSLRPLFGNGVLDQPITGNLPHRRFPGLAHGRYFNYPESTGPEDFTTKLHELLRLDLHDELEELLGAPDSLDESNLTR